MKVLVTGVKGQLGYDIVKHCCAVGIEAVGVDIDEMDITDFTSVVKVINESYDAVIHCAAWTAVDLAEDEVGKCADVNVKGTKNISDVCRNLNIPLMFFSTDYVFNGTGESPWKTTDVKEPLNAYGLSKSDAEDIVMQLDKFFIIRISWVFGINGNNFIKTMLRLGNEHGKVSVVNDQVGSPTYTFDLAKLCINMIKSEKYGVYHASNEGYCSWYEFACEIFKSAEMDVEVVPVDSNAFKTKAKRPMNSRMDKKKLTDKGFDLLPSWEDATARFIKELNSSK